MMILIHSCIQNKGIPRLFSATVMPMIYNNTKSRKRQGYFLNKFVMFCMRKSEKVAQTKKSPRKVEDTLNYIRASPASHGGYVVLG